ncbi:MAG: hypothetical protein GY781_02670 [Gammaproteobacteria bacterium]|nr:hypothetical protein [Gammaproteobacteria bacterium]
MVSPELIVIKRWTWKQFAIGIAAVFSVFILFYLTGYMMGDADGISLRNEKQQLLGNVRQLTEQLAESERQLVKQTQISKVDQAANVQAGNSLDSQQQHIRELERELTFFRSIMAPEESQKGLQIARFSWQQQDQETINWQISLIQAGSQGRAISGYVMLQLRGMQGNKEVILPLKNEKQGDRFNFRFKYFQHLIGSLKLDENIVPISVNVKAYPTLKGQPIIDIEFPWQPDEENIANVE